MRFHVCIGPKGGTPPRWPGFDVVRFGLAIGAAIALSIPLAAADAAGNLGELSLEQLLDVRVETVSGASKYEQKVTRAPASVTVVTRDEIEAFGHRTLADVLRSVRGLYVTNDSNYSYLGSRGFLRPGDYNSRTLVLVDGHRMNDNVYDAAYFGRENMVWADDIERVEVIRGPSSSVYGSSAFFGVVNVVTRRGRNLDGGDASFDVGSLGLREGRVAFGRLFKNDLEVMLSVSRYHSDGRASIYYPEFDPRVTSDPAARDAGVAREADAEDAFKLLSTVRYRDLTVSGLYVERAKTVPTASFGTAFDSGREKTRDSRGYVDLRYEHVVSPELALTGRAGYDAYSYRGEYPYDFSEFGLPGLTLNRDRVIGEWLSAEGQLTATIANRHTFIAGAEFRESLHQKQANYDDVSPRTTYIDDDRKGRTAAAYAQGELALAPGLLFNGGLRYDHYFDSFGGTLNPRAGLIYQMRPRTTVKALYGQAFRAPNVYERYYTESWHPGALSPEKVRTYELAIDQYFTGDCHAAISAYEYTVRGLITQVPLPGEDYYFANSDRYSARGLELEAEGRLAGPLHWRASYAVQRAIDDGTQRKLTNSPQHLGKLNVSLPLYRDRITAGVEVQHVGAVATLAGASAPAYTIGNLTLIARRLPGAIELAASVYNVLDRDYGYPGAADHRQDVLQERGRTFRFRLSARF